MPVQESSEKHPESSWKSDKMFGNVSFQASATSSFIVLFSFMLILAGVEYTTIYSSNALLLAFKGSSSVYPPIVLLISGLCMLCTGLAAFILGIIAILLSVKSRGYTIFVLCLESIFGIFTLAALMFGNWAFLAKQYSSQQSVVQFEMMCMLYMVATGTALLSGQFCLTIQFYKQNFRADNMEVVFSQGLLKALVIFYSFLVVVKGISELAIAELMRKASLTSTFSAPFFISRTEVVIADGAFTILLGLYGMIVGAAGLSRHKVWFVSLYVFSFVVQLVLYDLAQYANFPAPVSGTIKIQGVETAIWTAALMLIPAYFASMLRDTSAL
eukprot:766947-Hanusia_phi.AAC.5